MKHSKIVLVTMIASLLCACQQGGGFDNSVFTKQNMGSVAGAVGGGVVGSNIGGGSGKIAGTIAGTLLGAMIGSSIGKSLDNADVAAYERTSQRAMETAQPGQTLPWRNPQSGNYGSVTPTNYYKNNEGDYCREYTQTIVVGGQKQQGYGRACRQSDGTWKIAE